MLADLDTYSVADFIPFTAEVYLRLVERHNAWAWPMQWLGVALALVAIGLAWRGWGRAVALILTLAWLVVAVTYYARLYAEVTWAANYLAGAFIFQAGLMLGAGLAGRFDAQQAMFSTSTLAARTVTAAAAIVIVLGLLGWPVLALLVGHGWAGTEWFGLMPAPTVVTSVGLLLYVVRPRWLWLLLPIPVAWGVVTAAVERTLDLPAFWLLFAAGALALLGVVAKAFVSSRER